MKTKLIETGFDTNLLEFKFDYTENISHWFPYYIQISIIIKNKSKERISIQPLKLLSSMIILDYYFSQNHIIVDSESEIKFSLLIQPNLVKSDKELYLIYMIEDEDKKFIEYLRISKPKWIMLIKYALIWKKTRDVNYLSRRIEKDRLKLKNTLFALCSIIFRYFGFFDWALYIGDISKSSPQFRGSFEKSLDKTFANLIGGWGGSGMHMTIKDSNELESLMLFLEMNSFLKKPNLENVKVIIEEKASQMGLPNDELFRINNILSGIETDIFTFQLYNNALKDIADNKIPDFGFKKYSEPPINKNQLQKMIENAKNIPFSKINDKIKAFQECLIPTITQLNINNLTFIISNICYCKGLRLVKDRKNRLALLYFRSGRKGFQIIDNEYMINWCSYYMHRCNFYNCLDKDKFSDASQILDYLESEIIKFSTFIEKNILMRFFVYGFYILSRGFYFQREISLALRYKEKLDDYINQLKEFDLLLFNRYFNLSKAFSKEIDASMIFYNGDLNKKIELLEEARKVYFKIEEKNQGIPLIHIILNYKGLLEMESGNFKEAKSLFSKAFRTATKQNHDASLYKARADICSIFILIKEKKWIKLRDFYKKVYNYRHRRSTFIFIKTLEIISDLILEIEDESITTLSLAEHMKEFIDLTWFNESYFVSDSLVDLFFEIYASASLKFLGYPETLIKKIQNTAVERLSSEDFIKQEFLLESLVDLLERPWAFYLTEKALFQYRKYEEYKFIDPSSSTFRQSGLSKLFKALEVQLLYILRYYWKRLYGNEAEKRLRDKFENKSFDNFAYRDIVQAFIFINTEKPETFENCDLEWSFIENNIIPMRNKLFHGKIKQLPMSKIEDIVNDILLIFKKLSIITPIHFVVVDSIIDNYKVEFKVEVPFITRLVSADMELIKGNEYYGLIETKTKDEIIIKDIINYDILTVSNFS